MGNSTIFSYLLFTFLFTSFTLFFYFFFLYFFLYVRHFFFQFGTRVKIDTPLSYVVRGDQALTNESFFMQPSTQCTWVKYKPNKRFNLQRKLFLLLFRCPLQYFELYWLFLKRTKYTSTWNLFFIPTEKMKYKHIYIVVIISACPLTLKICALTIYSLWRLIKLLVVMLLLY